MRTPSVLECLSVFKAAFAGGIVEVIDVGAQTSTPFLMQSFHDARHHLFEPVVTYHSQLSANYAAAGIEHEIVAAAVSDAPGVMHQHLLSQDGSGRITHSQLLSAPDRVRFVPDDGTSPFELRRGDPLPQHPGEIVCAIE